MDYVTLSIEANESAGAGETWYAVVPWPGTWRLEHAYFMPDTTTGTDSTDFTTLALRNAADGADVGSLTTNATGGAALPAGTASAFTLSGDLEYLGQTEELKITKTDAASGKAVEGRFVLAFRKFRAS